MELRAEHPERLDQFLARKLPEFSRARLAELIDSGKVLVDGMPDKRSCKLKEGQRVVLSELPQDRPAHDLTPADIPLVVVYEDEHMLVVNKPRGLATHPAPSLKAPSLVNALLARGQELSGAGGTFRPGIVHRLDKDTTGLIVVAKSDSVHLALAKQFEKKSAERRYVAILEGELANARLTIDAPLARDPRNRFRMAVDPRGKPAVTHLKRLAEIDEGTLAAARLETGRTHQIRAHCKAVGHPVLGDPIYGSAKGTGTSMQLHAAYLAFDHPATGNRVEFFCRPPEDFLAGNLVSEAELRAW